MEQPDISPRALIFRNTHMKAITLTITLAVTMAGCGLYNVISTDKDEATDFTQYKTYAWLPDKYKSGNSLNNQIVRNNIKNYFSHEFADNYSLTPDVDMPDVLMEFQVTVADTTITENHLVSVPNNNSYPYSSAPYPANNIYGQNQYYTPYPNPYNYNNYNNGYSYRTQYTTQYTTRSETEQHNYTKSSITLNMIDRKRNELVWTVTAQADIYDENPGYSKGELHPAVHKMFKYFPLKKINVNRSQKTKSNKN